MSITSIRVL